MIYVKLYIEFFKIGLFAVGGGLATLPFLTDLSRKTEWFSESIISDMIAISESTPGPIGINMATYVGCNVAGFWGGVVATLGEITPAIIIICVVAKYLAKFNESALFSKVFLGLRPAVTGLVAVAGITIMKSALLSESQSVDIIKVLYCAFIFFCIKKYKKHPVFYILVSAIVGIILKF